MQDIPFVNYPITKTVYLVMSSWTLLLLNFNANTGNACANLSTRTIPAVPFAFRRAASCGVLRHIASCCGENDAACRAATRGTAVVKHTELECGQMPNVMAALPHIGGALWRQLLEYRAVTLPRRETRWNLHGCPKLINWSQPLVAKVHHIIRSCGGGIAV